IQMNNQAKIIFANDARIQANKQWTQYIEHHTNDFCTLFTYGQLFVAVKEIKEQSQSNDKVRMIAGSIARELSKHKVEKASVVGEELEKAFSTLTKEQVITAFVEGWNLGTYNYVTYRSDQSPVSTELTIEGNQDYDSFIKAGKNRAEAVAFSRDLMNDIPSALHPQTFPERLEEEFHGTDVDVKTFTKEDLEKMEMHGVLTVGQGSEHEPTFVEMTYQGNPDKPLVALVGKGVTFDTGGISLKRGRHLSDMRMDMGGAAAVAGAMKLLAASQADVNVVGLIPMVENMPDSTDVLPGDVIRYKNGNTIQIGNTDAEGRLILADGIIRAGELEADYIVDIATLTGAIVAALGSKMAGVFGDEQLSLAMKKLGDENGDFNWPMPLVDAYESYLKSDYADVNNVSSKSEAGSITAGLFLRRFVPEGSKWIHVDMAGVMESNEEGYYAKSATGYGARLLADFAHYVANER